MLRSTALFLIALLFVFPRVADAHCQVPCGIYGDQRRFETMLEDTQTIAKAIAQIGDLAGTHDATGHNQLIRWVVTKESHANNIQSIVSQYFLAQRIKSDSPRYVEQLKAAHAVIVAAMKTKQAADPASADVLKKSIEDLYRAYEGKEPVASNQLRAAQAIVVSHSHDATDHTHSHSHDATDHTHE